MWNVQEDTCVSLCSNVGIWNLGGLFDLNYVFHNAAYRLHRNLHLPIAPRHSVSRLLWIQRGYRCSHWLAGPWSRGRFPRREKVVSHRHRFSGRVAERRTCILTLSRNKWKGGGGIKKTKVCLMCNTREGGDFFKHFKSQSVSRGVHPKGLCMYYLWVLCGRVL